MSKFFIFIDSDSRSYGQNNCFNISLNDFQLQSGVNVSLSLDQADFYNLQYPVNSNNNTITFREAGDDVTTYTATIPEGNYTGSEIATEIATQMTANTGNAYVYVGSYDDKTGKITINETLPDTFKIVSIDNIFGIDSMTSFAATITGNNPVNLAGEPYVDLLLPSLLNVNMTTNSNTNGIIKRISLDVPWGGLVSYNSSESDDSVIIESHYLNNLRVEMRNPDGSLYNLPSNAQISIVLKCTILD